ncbi:hypothetical protein TNIN_393101 [Trichonephila inaurata madagascariensis]|uniref:Uncharacterized protein n=1 Tax=Trichonephila inaurata madagascariensis TaxID=2747483 RepID=A0A8X7CT02_9ARAC|nr:hypothetical protein TNIN_393101 [Trichonephila inaurata madagascariensis]
MFGAPVSQLVSIEETRHRQDISGGDEDGSVKWSGAIRDQSARFRQLVSIGETRHRQDISENGENGSVGWSGAIGDRSANGNQSDGDNVTRGGHERCLK